MGFSIKVGSGLDGYPMRVKNLAGIREHESLCTSTLLSFNSKIVGRQLMKQGVWQQRNNDSSAKRGVSEGVLGSFRGGRDETLYSLQRL